MVVRNIFAGIPNEVDKEIVEELVKERNVRIERIVSQGQASPPGFWYDQEEHEWVVMLSGKAGIQLEGQSEILSLSPGDFIRIPPHRKHRVEWTDATNETVWLAVFWKA